MQNGIMLPTIRNAVVVPNNTVVGNAVAVNNQRQNTNLINRNNNTSIGMPDGLPQLVDAPKVNTVGVTAINNNFVRRNPVPPPPPISNIRSATNTSLSSSSSHT